MKVKLSLVVKQPLPQTCPSTGQPWRSDPGSSHNDTSLGPEGGEECD